MALSSTTPQDKANYLGTKKKVNNRKFFFFFFFSSSSVAERLGFTGDASPLQLPSLTALPANEQKATICACASQSTNRQSTLLSTSRVSSSAADSRNGTGRIHGFKTENSFQILVDLQCCTGRRLILLLFLKKLKNVTAVLFYSGDPWHWKNSQSALRQVVGSLVPEIAPGYSNRLIFYSQSIGQINKCNQTK